RELLRRRLGIVTPVANAHARAVIDDDGGHVMLRLALLLDQRRVDQDEQQQREAQRAPDQPARTAPGTEGKRDRRKRGESRDRSPGQQWRKGEAVAGDGHCPSLSRMAGTCTWSDL